MEEQSATTVEAGLPTTLWPLAARYLDECDQLFWIVVDDDWTIRRTSRTCRAILGQRDRVGSSLLSLLCETSAGEVRQRAGSGRLVADEIELLCSRDGETLSAAFRFFEIDGGHLVVGRDQSQQIDLVAHFSDLVHDVDTDRLREQELAERLRTLASNDHLTGLPNRRRFEEILEDRWRAYSETDEHFSLICLDLDHFKAVNDRFGHAAGDEVLRRVAKALGQGLRGGDTVARIGGEEFVIVTERTESEIARQIAERVRRRIETCEMPEPVDRVTISVGVASTDPLRPPSAAELLQMADTALYAAKKLGRNRVEIAPAESPDA